MAITTDIRNELISAVQTVSVANGYNTDNVTTSKMLLPTSKLNAEQRRAHFSARWIRRISEPAGNLNRAEATFYAIVVMDNVTDEVFAGFLEDIEASIEKRTIITNVDGVYHGGVDVALTNIEVVDVSESISERVHEAHLTFTASYQYRPDNLSGN